MKRWRFAKPAKRDLARDLRRKQTHAEGQVWVWLRNRRMLGLKFRRQRPVAGFVVDFFCDELGLVLEIDGRVHDQGDRRGYDQERTAHLEALGLTVLRIPNDDVSEARLRNLIAQAVEQHSPLPERERGRG